MRHPKLVLSVAAAAAALLASSASADAPTFVPLTAADFTDTTTCAFPVSISFTMVDETAVFFGDGRILVTGPVKATFSANGKSVTLNVSGPTTIEGNTVFGHGVGAGPTALPGGGVTLAYNAGVADISSPVATLLHGHMLLDICAALT
jgi:hypothetical protein